MAQFDWKSYWQTIAPYLPNKYVTVCLFFALILTFCGDQSYIHQYQRHREIKEKKGVLREYQQKIQTVSQNIEVLDQSMDNLERFAREQYHMKAPGEDVYLIDEMEGSDASPE